MNFGIPIKKYREAKGITQIALAQKIGVTSTYISALENNRKEPSIALINKICETLDVPKEILFWETVSASIIVKSEDKEIIETTTALINEYYNQRT